MGSTCGTGLKGLDIIHKLGALLLKELAIAVVVRKGNAVAVHHIVIEELG